MPVSKPNVPEPTFAPQPKPPAQAPIGKAVNEYTPAPPPVAEVLGAGDTNEPLVGDDDVTTYDVWS